MHAYCVMNFLFVSVRVMIHDNWMVNVRYAFTPALMSELRRIEQIMMLHFVLFDGREVQPENEASLNDVFVYTLRVVL